MVRTKTNDSVLAVKSFCEDFKCSLKVAHCDIFINNKAFDLMKKRRMSRINFIGTVNSARGNNANRRLLFFHNTNLNRRCLSTKQNIIGYIECVLCIACRVIFRQIQRLKVIIIILYFGTVCN